MDVLIFNPGAGTAQSLGLTCEQLLSSLKDRGVSAAAPHEELSYDEIVEVAAKASGRIIVAGGDGTVHCVLKAVKACGFLQLAIIPLGTANHFADALGIPGDVSAAVDVVARGVARRVDLGVANGVVFTQAAGAGMHARAFHIYGEHPAKSIIDAASAALEIARSCEALMMRVRIDDMVIYDELTQVTAANTPSYGRLFTIAPEAKMDDGLLDVITIGRLSKLELLDYATAAITGRLAGMPKVSVYRGRKIVIESMVDKQVEIHADDTPAGYTPAEIEVLPGCLEVVVPAEAD